MAHLSRIKIIEAGLLSNDVLNDWDVLIYETLLILLQKQV